MHMTVINFSEDNLNVVFSGHGSTNAGGTGASNSAQDQDQFDNRSLWRDNVSSSSSNVQVRGGNEWIFFFEYTYAMFFHYQIKFSKPK